VDLAIGHAVAYGTCQSLLETQGLFDAEVIQAILSFAHFIR